MRVPTPDTEASPEADVVSEAIKAYLNSTPDRAQAYFDLIEALMNKATNEGINTMMLIHDVRQFQAHVANETNLSEARPS